ncbi:MAG: PIG-L family deacetylase [Candidatus Bathyarchaeota archaeon]|nr:PIG-L family deacetylase [Candidatus Bathyarchaeota archaeon]MDH5788530.1 PIG-L family deacetylase [Candidatus Bathyarchaeota archaeon]
MSKKIIVFAPHPDDETLGCGGTIAKKISEGYEVLVVVITDGRHSFSKGLGIDSDPAPEEVKEIRRDEVKRATKILGVQEENLAFLNFVDGTLEESESEVQEKVINILRENTPLEIYFPYEKDCHPDHRATNRIVSNAVNKLGIEPIDYRYMISHKYARVGPLINALLDLFRRNIVYVGVSKYLPLKKAALKEFRSELSIISKRQSKPRTKNFKKFLKEKEKFYIST